jgi:hypothetical protein
VVSAVRVDAEALTGRRRALDLQTSSDELLALEAALRQQIEEAV